MVRLGELIEEIDNPNIEDASFPFVGININKEFMNSVANTDTVDRRKYKIITKGQFVFSGMQTGRDKCIRIGLYGKETPALLSPAYTTFKVKDSYSNILIPEYLFLNFRREEMDRLGWFFSDASIRSNLDWDRFCDIVLPLPPISYQRQLVGIYKGLTSVIEENEALLEPLNAACQAYIVDCKEKYKAVRIGELVELSDERNTDGQYTVGDVVGISIEKKIIPTKANMDGVSLSSYKVLNPKGFCYVTVTSRNGDKISLALNNSCNTYIVSSSYIVFQVKDMSLLLPEFLFLLFNRPEFDRYSRYNSWGSARETFDWEEMQRLELPLPPLAVQRSIVSLYHCAEESRRLISEAREQLRQLCPALVQLAQHYNEETA